MSYNLESLVQILEEILHPPRHGQPSWHWVLGPEQKPQIESLLKKARSLKERFENCSSVSRDEVQNLESRIRDATNEAEDVIESQKAGLLLSRKEGRKVMIFPPDLQKVIGEFDVVEEEMRTITKGTQIRGRTSSLPVSSRVDPNPKNVVVGLNEDLNQLKERLTWHCGSLEIIPIVGMGGIGKTTLARKLYDDSSVVSHFDKRAWATISQEYDLREILFGLVRSLTGEQIQPEEEDKLGLRLHKALYGRRYLIVLDDMWSPKAWDDIKASFPNNNNGSRILVTTRDSRVANCAGLQRLHHQMKFLSEDDSRGLLFKKVFPGETCPPELEEIGKKIAKDCEGLPLAIHVVGGLLSELEKNKESWKQVAKDGSSAVASHEDQVSNILTLSYKHLPNHLKPCFLYLGAFPEDSVIQASYLIRLWVAEGFLKPISGKSLEEAAESYLKALVDRNLLMVNRQVIEGNVESYKIHDLLRELCIEKAREENFLLSMTNAMRKIRPTDVPCLRRLSAVSPDHLRSCTGATQLRTIIRPRPLLRDIRCGFDIFGLQMLKVLDVLDMIFEEVQVQEIGKLVNLRYLAFALHSKLPSSISNLCNLQTLILQQLTEIEEVREIFDMLGLRHIDFGVHPVRLSPPRGESVVLQDLQTLSTVEIDNNFPKILEAIPNIRELGISGGYQMRTFRSFCLTWQSKTFKCRSVWSYTPRFQPSLRKLIIGGCKIPRGYMNKIGTTFSNLEMLKLKNSEFEGRTWQPTEGEFCRLRILLLQGLNLEKWVANKAHYPRLERLVIRNCNALEEIPSGIEELSTLKIIEVDEDSRLSAVARKIQEEQLRLGNHNLRVHINATLSSHFDEDAHGQSSVLQAVETPSTKEVGSSFPKILEAIRNLKKLGISRFGIVGRLFDSNPCSVDLTCLSELETLKCQDFGGSRHPLLSFVNFPPSLKLLTIHKCTIPTGCMNKIGNLPNLEELKLRYSELEGRMWEPTQGEFRRLRFLLLEELDLQEWIADWTHYPSLERLVIRDCGFLEEIPSAMAAIPTLLEIEVDGGCRSFSEAFRSEMEKQSKQFSKFRFVSRFDHFDEDWAENSDSVGLEDIQTLFPIDVDDRFAKILEAIPNLKNAGIPKRLSYLTSSRLDLTCLSKLETLGFKRMPDSAFSSLVVPPSLKKLVVHESANHAGSMNKIGTLPNLEVLELHTADFEDRTWEPAEGEFCRLRYLLLDNVNLEKWIADETHYPRLEQLIIKNCKFLEEIPSGMGDISTLEIIAVFGEYNRPSIVDSARKIQEEQREWGDDTLLQVIIRRDH